MSQKKRKIGKSQVVEEKMVFGLNQKQRSRIYTILFFVVVTILFIVNNSADDTKQGPYPPNYKTQGEILKLSDLKGKVVLVDFWATWCAPCREGIPDLIALKNEFKDKDVEIVGISVDAISNGGATAADVIPFIKAYKINYPVVRGDQLSTNAFGGIRSIPTSFLIDKEGRVVEKYERLVSKESYIKSLNKILDDNYESSSELLSPNFSLALIESK